MSIAGSSAPVVPTAEQPRGLHSKPVAVCLGLVLRHLCTISVACPYPAVSGHGCGRQRLQQRAQPAHAMSLYSLTQLLLLMFPTLYCFRPVRLSVYA